MDGSSTGNLGSLFLLLIISAFFSGSEAAFLAVSRTRVRQLEEEGRPGARLLHFLLRRRPLVLTTLLLGITLSNYTAERLATGLAVEHLDPRLGPLVAVVVMTTVIIVCCEVIPIHFGARYPEALARVASTVVAPVALLLSPLVMSLSVLSRGLLHVLGVRTGSLLPGISEDHLKAMIEQSEEQGVLAAGERRMMHGVLDFGEQTVAQVMTPRPDMVCVEAREPLAEALRLGLESNHSRLPVYENTPDDIVGVLYLKDLLPYVLTDELDRECRVVARSVHHVPETLPANELLTQLQHQHRTLAIVKDEYGGTAGLVTIEDLLEEIVGDIHDEYDTEEPEIVVVGPGEFLCDARVALHQLEDAVSEELPTEEYDSLGGLVLDLAGRIPAVGEVFRWGRLRFEVTAVTGPRVEQVRVLADPDPLRNSDQDGEPDD
ncbi:MAG: HlyC/CorC family transporter [Armatimonadetes bacterium]|nr:HlyC/CorC family transporter [Armatimonadota bacterium]